MDAPAWHIFRVLEYSRFGWSSRFPEFRSTSPLVIRGSLQDFITDASIEQVRAWDDSIPALQREVGEILDLNHRGKEYTAVLEYELPMDMRRPDVIFLLRAGVLVMELKGKREPSQADLDQAAAYGRDLRCYHRACEHTAVHVVVVPTRANGVLGTVDGVTVMGPDAIDAHVEALERDAPGLPVHPDDFLAENAYRPLPTLVEAARELFQRGDIRPIHRARAVTDPAVDKITEIIHRAARNKSRHLVLVTGVPGAGKTLVGLRMVHAHFLDDLAVARANGKPTAPAVFLSGNGPLVEVLSYELKGAGGGGRTFVRGVKEYVRRYSSSQHLVPPEHVLVFDEAQRAFDAEQVREKHGRTPGFEGGRSEPEHFIEFAERIPEWCVVIGLIGSGQEIHVGEEAGLVQWRHAIEGARRPEDWHVHLPDQAADVFADYAYSVEVTPPLSLDTEIRFHLATDIHKFVASLLEDGAAGRCAALARQLESLGYHLRITRDLDVAKDYLRERYREDVRARFGMVASSKDKELERWGVPNGFQATKQVRYGPWYSDNESDPGGSSCRHLRACVTEFGAQGLELDAALLAWGTDFIRRGGKWSNVLARGYLRKAHVRNPFQLRLNAYRVLLTRGRDVTMVFVPPVAALDETHEFLVAAGFRSLGAKARHHARPGSDR